MGLYAIQAKRDYFSDGEAMDGLWHRKPSPFRPKPNQTAERDKSKHKSGIKPQRDKYWMPQSGHRREKSHTGNFHSVYCHWHWTHLWHWQRCEVLSSTFYLGKPTVSYFNICGVDIYAIRYRIGFFLIDQNGIGNKSFRNLFCFGKVFLLEIAHLPIISEGNLYRNHHKKKQKLHNYILPKAFIRKW
jgi:hypothetical protein